MEIKDVKRIYDEVCAEFRRKIPLVIDDSQGTAYFNWDVVGFPRKFAKKSENFVRNVLRHEHGHKAIFPQDPEVGIVVEYIGKFLGFSKPWIFANIIADMIVDSTNIKIFGEKYLRFLEESLSNVRSETESVLSIMGGYYRKVAEELGLKTTLPYNNIGNTIYYIMNDAESSLYKKIIEIGRLLKMHSTLEEPVYVHLIIHKCMDGMRVNPADVARILIKKGIPIDDVFDEDTFTRSWSSWGDIKIVDNPVVIEYIKMMIVAKYMEMKNAYGYNEKMETVPSDWELGDEIESLDVISTISSFGIVIPGIYSLKNVESYLGFESGGENPDDALIVLDCSGSMQGMKFERARESAYVIARKTYEAGRKVGLIPFGSDVPENLVIKPTRDIYSILNMLARLLPTSGTNLYNALHYAKGIEGRPTIYVFTDAYTGEIDGCMNVLKQIKGKVIIFLVNDRIDHANEWVLRAGVKVIQITPEGLIRRVWNET